MRLLILAYFSSAAPCFAAFSNYSTILIGERAGGMGGAFTALTGDASAASYYNPAALARMDGASLTASANVYYKGDIVYGNTENFEVSQQRINRGYFRSIPVSSGSVYNFGPFAIGINIIVPDYEFFAGDVAADKNTTSYLSMVDESLWIGGSMALNIRKDMSLGWTIYYTARNLVRTTTDQTVDPSGNLSEITTEEKTLTNNSIIYILGWMYEIDERISVGASCRFPSLEVAGNGDYFRSQTNVSPLNTVTTNYKDLRTETKIPPRINLGVASTDEKRDTISLDVTYHGEVEYEDMEHEQASTHVHHRPTWNAAIGYETPINPWLKWRAGIFTNLSSHAKIDLSLKSRREGDHIDMWGASSNFAISTSANSQFTLGGYYTGGRGYSVQEAGQQLKTFPKSAQIFTLFVGTSYHF